MGMRIGNGTEFIRAPSGTDMLGASRLAQVKSQDPLKPDPAKAADVFRQEKPQPPKLGLGKGTVSEMTAAARSLGKNLKAARNLVPTLAEQREELREKVRGQREIIGKETAELQARKRAKERAGQPGNVALDIAKSQAAASQRAREIVTNINNSAGAALFRTGMVKPPMKPPTIHFSGETLELGRPSAEPTIDFFA